MFMLNLIFVIKSNILLCCNHTSLVNVLNRLRGFEPHAGSKHPSTVFFTFQFYRFEQVTSERFVISRSHGRFS